MKKLTKSKLFSIWLDRNIKSLIELYGIGGVTMVLNDNTNRAVTSKRGSGDVLFRIHYSLPYKTAHMWYYRQTLEMFNKKNFKVLRQALTHEIAHIMTAPLAELANDRYAGKQQIDDTIENLTESIGQLCRKLLDAKNIEMM